jgi:hypothetical protein
MEKNNVLGGFDAIFETLSPNEDIKLKGVEVIEDPNDTSNDTQSIDGDIVEENQDELDSIETAENKDDETTEETTEGEEVDEDEKSQVIAFFDALAEQVGWSDVTDEEKPKSVEDFVAYMKNTVEANSIPKYASEEIAALDEFVKNGGNLSDYYSSTGTDINYESLNIEDVDTQKELVKAFLSEKGFTEAQIAKKIEKYEDADLLEDEAADAIEFLKESKDQKRKELLENQKIVYQQQEEEQQKFYNNVVQQIETLSDVRGIKIPKEEKRPFTEFLLKVGPDGKTGYQKKYSESATKNLIESAYFTWKGDALIAQAKRDGETSATQRLRNSLKTNKVGGSKQSINNGSATPLWSIAAQQLIKRP